MISAIDFWELKEKFPEKAKEFFRISASSEACPCGSGKKFCECCFSKFKHLDRRNKRKEIRKFFKK